MNHFWRLFASDILPSYRTQPWTCISIAVEGPDGRFVFEPSITECDDTWKRQRWAMIRVRWWEEAIYKLAGKLNYDAKIQPFIDGIVDATIRAAEQSDLPKLADRNQVTLRFHIYDNPIPFREV